MMFSHQCFSWNSFKPQRTHQKNPQFLCCWCANWILLPEIVPAMIVTCLQYGSKFCIYTCSGSFPVSCIPVTHGFLLTSTAGSIAQGLWVAELTILKGIGFKVNRSTTGTPWQYYSSHSSQQFWSFS